MVGYHIAVKAIEAGDLLTTHYLGERHMLLPTRTRCVGWFGLPWIERPPQSGGLVGVALVVLNPVELSPLPHSENGGPESGTESVWKALYSEQ